jgi:hypothetical protein
MISGCASDINHNKHKRAQTKYPLNPQDYRYFTIDEIRKFIEGLDRGIVPGEDGITGEIYLQYISQKYNHYVQ